MTGWEIYLLASSFWEVGVIKSHSHYTRLPCLIWFRGQQSAFLTICPAIHPQAMYVWLTCCHCYAHDVRGWVRAVSLNWKTEAVQVSFDGLQKGDVFKTDLNIHGVFFLCGTTHCNWNESFRKTMSVFVEAGERSWWIPQQGKLVTHSCR